MSIQGPSSNPSRAIVPPAIPGPRPGAPASPASRSSAAAEASRAASGEPTSLWQLLTPEERTFFQQLATTGSLTYAPGARGDEQNAAAPKGQRLDVRG